MTSRRASARTEQPKLPLGENKPVDNFGDVDNESTESEDPPIEVSVEGDEPPEPKVEVKEPDKPDDKTVQVSALQKQLDDLRKSEELARTNHEQALKEREEALRAKAKAEGEAQKYRSDSEQSSLDAINNALAAARSEIESAEHELETAIANADPKGQAAAYRKIAKAESNIGRLEDGQAELEYRIKASKNERQREVETATPKKEEPKKQDIIEAMPVPDRAKEWLREHREYAEDPRKNAKLQVVHWEALDEGHKEFSTGYFSAVERLLGLGEEPEADEEPEEKPQKQEQRRTSIVSAPVSREGSSGGSAPKTPSSIKLTKDQAEIARSSGITNAEYAKQLLRLQEEKRSGHYGEGR